MSEVFYKEKQIIGIDITPTGIKTMAVNPHKWHVQAYGSVDLDPAQYQSSLDDNDSTYLSENIKELFSHHILGQMPSNHVALSVPTNKSYTRTFSLPTKELKNLKSAIELEVEQYIPIPYSALYVAHEIFSKDAENALISIAATPKNMIDAYIKAVRAANLMPVLVEPGIYSVARLLRLTEEGHLSTLIVDVSQATTDIAIYDNGAVQVSGGVDIGGNTFTLEISKHLKTPLENAHQLKVLNGLLPGPHQENIQKALDSSLKKIATEIRKVIRYYTERLEGDNKVDQLIILGAGSNMPGIGEFFTNELVMPARVANPWQRLNFQKLESPNKQFRPRYITSAGLASLHYKEVF